MSAAAAPPRSGAGVPLGPHRKGMPMTPAAFDAVAWGDCDAGFRYELVRGRLAATPMPGAAVGAAVDALVGRLNRYRLNA